MNDSKINFTVSTPRTQDNGALNFKLINILARTLSKAINSHNTKLLKTAFQSLDKHFDSCRQINPPSIPHQAPAPHPSTKSGLKLLSLLLKQLQKQRLLQSFLLLQKHSAPMPPKSLRSSLCDITNHPTDSGHLSPFNLLMLLK